MTRRDDDLRDLVGQAYAAEPEPIDFDITEGLRDVLNRAASSLGTSEARSLRAQNSPGVLSTMMACATDLANRMVRPALVVAGGGSSVLTTGWVDSTPDNGLDNNASSELVSDLKRLRKGRGLDGNNVGERVGHTLRDLCGVTEHDDPGQIRVRIAQRLEHLAVGLPEDLRTAVLAAFGMIPAARHPLYQERVNWIAERSGRDSRIARRRIDDAIYQLAQLACTPLRLWGTPEPTTAGWHTATTRVFLTLEGTITDAIEHHQIVAAQDGLREVELATVFSQPVVLNGGTLRGGALVLPSPLKTGEAHDFWIRSRHPVRPRQFLYLPRRRCDYLELRVHFDSDSMPRWVSRLQGRPPRDLGSVPLNKASEVQMVFRDLIRGMAYGARWQ